MNTDDENEYNYMEYINSSSSEEEENDEQIYERQKLYLFIFKLACECISGILILLTMLIIIILWIYWMFIHFDNN